MTSDSRLARRRARDLNPTEAAMLKWFQRRSETTQGLIVSGALGVVAFGLLLFARWM
jgi:hypothetical protein